MHNQLAMSVIGEHETELIAKVARVVSENGCSLNETHVIALGSHFLMMAQAHGNWNGIAKLEAALGRMSETDGLLVQSTRLGEEEANDLMPYAVELIAADREGIVFEVLSFLTERELHIQDLHAHTFTTPGMSAVMFSLQLTIGIPVAISVAAIRTEFMDFCDERNFDGVLAPAK